MGSYIEIQLSNDIHPKVRIDFPKSIGSIETVLEELVKPALLASGFQQETVNKIMIVDTEDSI